MKEVWSREQRAAYLTAALTTAGGVLFIGDLDRNFRAHDVKTGEVLWQARLGTAVQGFPVTFAANGKVTLHRDYWDAAEELYARLPVLKWLMRALARQAAAPR